MLRTPTISDSIPAPPKRRSHLRHPALSRPACGFALLLGACTPFSLHAQPAPASTLLSRPAHDWALDAAKNEIGIVEYNGVYLRYRAHIVNAKGEQVRDVIESKDGTVARLISKERRPLTHEEDAAERDRLQTMLDSPAAFAKHIKGDQSGKKLAVALVKLMPEAMLYDYVPGQPQRPQIQAHPEQTPEIVLDFKPNPDWNPPTLPSQALIGLQGRLWIDPKTHHLVRLEGEIFRPVSVGWSLIAHINPGGKLTLDQSPVSDKRWIFSHFVEQISLRALMIKNITENSQIDSSEFSIIPAVSYQEAIRTLLQTPVAKELSR